MQLLCKYWCIRVNAHTHTRIYLYHTTTTKKNIWSTFCISEVYLADSSTTEHEWWERKQSGEQNITEIWKEKEKDGFHPFLVVIHWLVVGVAVGVYCCPKRSWSNWSNCKFIDAAVVAAPGAAVVVAAVVVVVPLVVAENQEHWLSDIFIGGDFLGYCTVIDMEVC